MQSTKRTLLTNVTALLLCFVMLIGTTFAWFTDEVTSANNIIKSGNLDIGMSWSNDNENWNQVEGVDAKPVFDYDRWEPGYTEVRYIKVQNLGSLSFKYQMAINPVGFVGKLAEVIDVSFDIVTGNDAFVAPTKDNKQGSLTTVATLKDIINGNGVVAGGVLLPKGETAEGYYTEEIVVCISFHMQETAGNEYQKESIGEGFGINLYATQFDYENDSFDSSYDDNATWPEISSGVAASTAIDASSLLLGALTSDVSINGNGFSANVPKDVKVADGATRLDLTVKSADADGNIILGGDENAQGFDVHIEGIAADNTKPMTVNLGAILPTGLSNTELKLYHTENGTPVEMTRVNSTADFAIHNQYTYNAETGEVSIYVATFSIFSAVKTGADTWDGEAVATGFASGTGTENDPYIINTAAQLVYFRNQVDAGVTYGGKFIKLNKDIDLANKLFDPIGYGYNTVFSGTFDGGNHTIYNLYQNGWELGYSYGTQGGGLFASIKDSTIKNLVIDGANIRMECVDMGVVVGYAQGRCHFENIVVTNSTIANYNRYTGGVVGEVSNGAYGTDVSNGYSHTFKNIVVDSSVVVSSLWGSFDTSIGGVIGGKWGDATVKMENVIVAAELDVYSDVTAAYQWYAYRRCGMLIGHTEIDSPKKGLNVHEIEFLTCDNVKVYYGDWVNYNYYEFANQDSDTGKRYPWVRAEASPIGNNPAFSNPRYGVPAHSEVIITNENKDTYKTGYAAIKFDQLYGGGQGVYGKADHKGVTTTVLTDTKTIYFQNNWNWTNLKIYYWYENGDNEWTTVVNGISLTGMADTKVGGYDLYKFEIPAYVAGYQIEGLDGTTHTVHSTHEVYAENIVDGNIYWFLYANGEYSMAASKFENGTFEKHEIYLIGAMNSWTPSSEWKLTKSADGKTWTGTFTIDNASNVKLYNTKVLHNQSAYIAQEGIANNADTSLAPGKYKFTYNVATNTFTFTMIERIIYLKTNDSNANWNQGGAWFAAWVWGSSKADAWYTFEKTSESGIYKVAIPADATGMKINRMSNVSTEPSWDKVEGAKKGYWNQTGDITIPTNGDHLFTIKQWDGQTTGWSKK